MLQKLQSHRHRCTNHLFETTKLRKQRSTAAQGQGHRQCQSKGLGEEPKGIEDESCCLRAAETGTVIVENINIVELVNAEQEFCEEWMILCHLG